MSEANPAFPVWASAIWMLISAFSLVGGAIWIIFFVWPITKKMIEATVEMREIARKSLHMAENSPLNKIRPEDIEEALKLGRAAMRAHTPITPKFRNRNEEEKPPEGYACEGSVSGSPGIRHP